MMVYQRGDISVDQNFARFGAKSYAINKITSVDVRMEKRTGCGWMIFAGLASIFWLFAFSSRSGEGGAPNEATFSIAFILSIVALIMWRGRPRKTYYLLLSTAAGEVQATRSTDLQVISELRSAIEGQIAKH